MYTSTCTHTRPQSQGTGFVISLLYCYLLFGLTGYSQIWQRGLHGALRRSGVWQEPMDFGCFFPCCYGMVQTPTDAASGLPHSENAILVPSGLLHPDRITRVMDRRCFPGVIKTIRWDYRIQSPSVGERACPSRTCRHFRSAFSDDRYLSHLISLCLSSLKCKSE